MVVDFNSETDTTGVQGQLIKQVLFFSFFLHEEYAFILQCDKDKK